uniref:Uncharacterized protein n=1 Tax=Chromera velia CCMP2878 TaxID=1169474 RepID=A0A0G4HGV4_9ALVE|eukprot:Cvel_27417.t1-p1 / transcript=Cvel_27417.t1 / gene=Cvel_27417 / organism=Chromera_velia_CCMP2878 / gene_product=hypothetical protein / transcript_product=hypothetical protein / location=Cvel_scaffold3417:5897-6337(+) / protein_length=147 / sequence_SO=supercontig / SO=protein_coding / is_pseudo=false
MRNRLREAALQHVLKASEVLLEGEEKNPFSSSLVSIPSSDDAFSAASALQDLRKIAREVDNTLAREFQYAEKAGKCGHALDAAERMVKRLRVEALRDYARDKRHSLLIDFLNGLIVSLMENGNSAESESKDGKSGVKQKGVYDPQIM